jgi:hypothetical protein
MEKDAVVVRLRNAELAHADLGKGAKGQNTKLKRRLEAQLVNLEKAISAT